MSATLSIILSIFGLVGFGYLMARVGLLSAAVGEGLTDFVFVLAIPLLLFETLATADFHGVSPWKIWGAYFSALAIVWTVGQVMICRVFGRELRAGIVGGGSAAYSNGVLIGLPLMQAALGERGAVFLIVVVAIHLPVMMLVSTVLNEWALAGQNPVEGENQRALLARRLALGMLRHPILIGIAAGVAWRLTGLPIPAAADHVIEPLANAAGPLALFATGMALVNYGISRQVAPAVALAALKLILLPALVFAFASLAGLPPIGIAALTLTAACPTGVNAFLIATRFGTGQALASNTLLISTAAGVATMTAWLALMRAFV